MTADAKGNGAPHAGYDPVTATISFWSQWMEQTTRGTQAILEAMQSVGDPNELQRRWAEVMSESADQFMRTPVFMEMMRRNMKNVTDMKRMQDNVVQDAARSIGLPLADDITGLFERLNRTEEKILGRLEAIEERLAQLEHGGNGVKETKKRATGQGHQGESHH